MDMVHPGRSVRAVLLDFLKLRQTNRLLRLDFPRNDAPPDTLLVANRLHALEALSRDFVYTVEVLSDRPDIPLKSLMAKMATVSLTREDGSTRYFNGYVSTFRFVKNDSGFCFYEMTLTPWLVFLRHRRNSCLYNGLSVQSQANEIFGHYRIADWQVSNLGADDNMTDACQFDESDYNYVHRRFEARGWHYRYSHRADGHTLELSGDSVDSEPMDGSGTCLWHGSKSGVKAGGLRTFGARRTIVPTAYAASSFDFKRARISHADVAGTTEQGRVPRLEVYEYLGAYGMRNAADGERLARIRMDEFDAAAKQFDGAGDDDHIQAGRTFILGLGVGELGAVSAPGDDEFLVVVVTHTASNNYEIAMPAREDRVADYANTFTCIRKKIAWRPGREFNSKDTRIHGVMTATVTGLPNEELFTDEHGRVLVEFHWGREGDHTRMSAWVRVASGAAGPGYGAIFIPRSGEEVLVQWLDSNPDRPIITGRVYNAANLPPRFNNIGKLPQDSFLSGLKSKEVNGGGYNQLRLDDTPRHLSTQLLSSHGQSQMNLGLLRHPREENVAAPRGAGVEVATNESVALRAAKGMLVSAWERLDACGNQLSCEEHVALMQACVGLFKTVGKAAAEQKAVVLDVQPQERLQASVAHFDKGCVPGYDQAPSVDPAIAMTAPEGLSFGTPKAIVSYAGQNIDTVAHHHLQHVAGKNLSLNAGHGVSIFAQREGIRQIAHYGKFVMQSQHDDIAINAAKNLTMTATDGVLKIMAKEIHLIAEDGSFVKLGGGVTSGSNGDMHFKAAAFEFKGPATMHTDLPFFAGEGRETPPWIGLHYINPVTSEPMAGAEYEIHLDGGPTITGKLDEQGKARHDNVVDKPVKKVIYKARPAKNDDPFTSLDFLLT